MSATTETLRAIPFGARTASLRKWAALNAVQIAELLPARRSARKPRALEVA